MLFPFHDDNPTERTPLITVGLIVINTLAFLAVLRLPKLQQQVVAYRRGFLPARIAQLKDPNLVIKVPVRTGQAFFDPRLRRVVPVTETLRLEPNRREILTSLLTCMFLHGGWVHLIGNMWFLWVFGNNVEDRLGPLPFLIVYLLGGLLGSGAHWMRDPASLTPVIGASGAIATVLGAYAITWPWARVHTLVFLFVFITVIDLPALMVLGIWFLIQLWQGTQEVVAQNVAWWAHIGGFAAGAVLMPVFSAVLGVDRRNGSAHPTVDWG